MDETQNWTIPTQEQVDAVAVEPERLLKLQQEWWIDFCALGGIITGAGFDEVEKNGRQVQEILTRMTVTQFSQKIGVPRSTLYHWSKNIPNFGDRVRQRRNEVWSIARETAVFNRLYLIGMSGNGQPAVTALQTLAAHFSKLESAPQRKDGNEGGDSWTSMFQQKRKVIEAEIVDEPSSLNS